MTEPNMDTLSKVLDETAGIVLKNEADVQRRFIEPCLRALGWSLDGTNTEVWLPLSASMARLWNYSSGRMRRDYVLRAGSAPPLHIEAKHRWARFSFDMDVFLDRINADDWNDTTKDGPKKDLALVLWGARSQGGRRAALMDEARLIVFDWDGRWRLMAEREISAARREDILATFRLLGPAVGQ